MRLITAAAFLFGSALAAAAAEIPFSSGWKEQRLSLFRSNDYIFGNNLGVVSDGAVSIVWTRVAPGNAGARKASWDWTVAESVPPTDLSRKGGDDRNLSLYFVFVPEAVASEFQNASIRKLRGNNQVRVLQYAWGGNHARGQVIPSPYAPNGQGATIALRQASTGSHRENVDLSSDYSKAFGGTKGALIGLAVSADSDDTDSVIRAAIGRLVLQ